MITSNLGMTPLLAALLTGLLIGGSASLLGGAFSYWIGLRRPAEYTGAPLVYLFLVPMILSVLGAVALLGALFDGRSVGLVLATGVGVVIGFTLVFGLLLFYWVRRETT